MHGFTKKRISFLSAIKIKSRSKMPSSDPSDERETVALLDGRRQKRCCCGRFRVNGSDGVWAWGVAFANFLVNFIIVGLGRMSGIFYVELINMFNVDRKTASIPFSVQQAGRNLFGPAAGILGQKYGLRSVTILGGVIGSLSAILTYFKMDITSMTVFWGVLFGLSTALTTTLNQVSIDQYFERHRATAGGFAFSGGGVGAMFFPIVLQTLIHDYGMRGTFLVVGAIILNVIPAAMVLIDPPWKRGKAVKTPYSRNIKQYGAFKFGESTHSNVLTPNDKLTKPHETELNQALAFGVNFKILRENDEMVHQFLTMEISDGSVRSKNGQNSAQKYDKTRLLNELDHILCSVTEQVMNEQNLSVSPDLQKSKKTPSVPEKDRVTLRPENMDSGMALEDVPYRVFIEHKLQELSGIRGTRIISHFPYPDQHRAWKVLVELRKLSERLAEMPHLEIVYKEDKHLDSSDEINNQSQEDLNSKKPTNSFRTHIKTALKLHGNPLFLLICLCRGVFMLTFIPFVTIIVDFAMDKGLSQSDGKYCIAVLSLGDFIGRLGLGWITDRAYLSIPKYMLFGMVLLGVSSATLPYMNSRLTILSSVMLFAILQGSLFVRHPLLVSQYVKEHEKSIGMGFINFLSGFLGFALPAFIGYFRDTLGSYDQMFYVNGTICALVGLLWSLEPLLVFFVSSRTEETRRISA